MLKMIWHYIDEAVENHATLWTVVTSVHCSLALCVINN